MGWLLTPQVCCVTAQQAAYFIIVTLHGSLSKFCIDTANCGCNLEERKQSTTNCDGNNKKYTRFFSQKSCAGRRCASPAQELPYNVPYAKLILRKTCYISTAPVICNIIFIGNLQETLHCAANTTFSRTL